MQSCNIHVWIRCVLGGHAAPMCLFIWTVGRLDGSRLDVTYFSIVPFWMRMYSPDGVAWCRDKLRMWAIGVL